ncbi:hypothetical protein E3N88_01641 [Mikania micrantha]|uniref:Uncharacterized protein n=1 Tax=Mikania micrantha TaxID=192012 RepID=A0A5N6Q1I8_9ASTR|nr:hypothetical protein E3N88_01641 [Mikania micrantha]
MEKLERANQALQRELENLKMSGGKGRTRDTQVFHICDSCGELSHVYMDCPGQGGREEEVNQLYGDQKLYDMNSRGQVTASLMGFFETSLAADVFQHKVECLTFNRQSEEIAENRAYRRSMINTHKEYQNRDFLFNKEIRHELDYEREYPDTVRPHPTDWANLPPYAETHQLPRRSQSNSSNWLSPYPQTQDPGASSSSETDPLNTTLQLSLFESIFGESYSKPPYDD